MKLIDILNKIADGTLEDGSVIKYDRDLYEYDRSENTLLDKNEDHLSYNAYVEECLNDEVELLEKREEIAVNTVKDISEEFEKIKELGQYVSEFRLGGRST